MTEHEADAADSAASRLFDLRTVIAVLFAIYGVVVTIMGFTSTSDDDIRAGRRHQPQPVERRRDAPGRGGVRGVGAPAAAAAAHARGARGGAGPGPPGH